MADRAAPVPARAPGDLKLLFKDLLDGTFAPTVQYGAQGAGTVLSAPQPELAPGDMPLKFIPLGDGTYALQVVSL